MNLWSDAWRGLSCWAFVVMHFHDENFGENWQGACCMLLDVCHVVRADGS